MCTIKYNLKYTTDLQIGHLRHQTSIHPEQTQTEKKDWASLLGRILQTPQPFLSLVVCRGSPGPPTVWECLLLHSTLLTNPKLYILSKKDGSEKYKALLQEILARLDLTLVTCNLASVCVPLCSCFSMSHEPTWGHRLGCPLVSSSSSPPSQPSPSQPSPGSLLLNSEFLVMHRLVDPLFVLTFSLPASLDMWLGWWHSVQLWC